MGIRTMTYVGPPLEPKDVRKLEEKLGATLPSAYKKFLLEYNGGTPVPSYFKTNMLAEFLSVNVKDKLYDLVANRRQMRKWIPAEVIPIARDTTGNMICLAIKGKNRGKVYFWDHEGGSEKVDPRIEFPWLELGDDYEFKGDDWPGHPDLTLIADSFDELLDSFHDEDEAPAPDKKAKKKRKK